MRAVAWRSLKRRRLRTFFTSTAIALGVANVFGVFVTNDSMETAVERRARSATGGADAIASMEGRPWISDEDVERLEALPGVRAFLRWGTYKKLDSNGRTAVFLQAVDLDAGRELIVVRDGRLPRTGEAEVALTEIAARVLGAGIGDRVKEARPDKRDDVFDPEASPDPDLVTRRVVKGLLTFTVSGIIQDFPAINAEANYGSVTSNEFMWKIEEPDRVVEMGLLLEDGVDPSGWLASAEVMLPHVSFRSSAGLPLLHEFLRSFRALLTGTAALALFIGAFLIYLIFTLALAERTRLVGLFHAVGASPGQIAGTVLREALMLGITSTLAGIVIGLALGSVLLRLVAAISGLGIETSMHLSASPFAAAIVVGIVATLVGAAVPAVRAARMTPVEAVTGRTRLAPRPKAWIAGIPLFAGGSALIATRGLSSDAVSQIGITGVLLGAVFVVPLGVTMLATATRSIVAKLVPGSGIVVLRHLTREPGRSAYTLSLVMLVLAAVVALTSASRSLQDNNRRVVDARFGADLILYGNDIGELTPKVNRTPGVSGATTVAFGRRVGFVAARAETANLVRIDPDEFFEIAGFPWHEGNDAEAKAALESRAAILVPARLAKRHDVHAGGHVRLRTASGERRYLIAGTYGGGGTGPEIGVVGSAHDEFLGGDDAQSAVYMNFTRGVDRRQMLARLTPMLREHGGLSERAAWKQPNNSTWGMSLGPYYAISGAEIKEQARNELDGYVRLFSAVIGVIVVAGALGMATALATSVVLRTRELGTIEALGATRSHVRRMVLAESLLLTLTAYLLSIGLGAVIAWLFIGGITELTGSYVPVLFAWGSLPFVGILALLIAAAAAYVPARRAMRITPVEALRYE